MTKQSYSELLRDPRWQKRRLEILNRDEFTCQNCCDSKTTLNVHHCYYEKGRAPWEYEDSSLVTLCEPCHAIETQNAYNEKMLLVKVLSSAGFLASHFNDLASTLSEALESGTFSVPTGPVRDSFVSAFAWALCDPEMQNEIRLRYFDRMRSRRDAEGKGNG